jgi:chemotaxis protein MotB
MSAPQDQKRPIIIVKKHGGHHDDEHGGQWKVAYADFVTAMMAFFLIMWLLSSASQPERQIIAQYFNSTSMFDMPAGSGVLAGGKGVMEGQDTKQARGQPSARDNTGKVEKVLDAKRPDKSSAKDREERQRFEALKAELERMMASGELKSAANNVEVTMTSEGLRINIFDRDGEAMFVPGGSEPTARLKMILGVVAQVLGTVKNAVILTGHTDAAAMQRAAYSNWELSADRANAVRRSLSGSGLTQDRLLRVEGRAAVDLLMPQAPLDPRNRRIAVTILRSDVEQQMRAAR